MLIKPSHNEAKKRQRLIAEMETILSKKPITGPICQHSCAEYDPAKGCNRMCSKASEMLSSDPDYPVEDLITPLVYEIKNLGIFEPCWSCEGHNDPQGKLWKKPNVWFYCDSVIHLRAFSNAIDMIYNKNKLSTRWIVELTHSDMNNPDTTFCLKPLLDDVNVSLNQLHKDVETIYSNLAEKFLLSCEKLKNSAM